MKQFITFLMLMLALTLAPMSAVADYHDTVVENAAHQLPLGRYFWQMPNSAGGYSPSGGYEDHYYLADVPNEDETVPDNHKAGVNPLTSWAVENGTPKSMEAFLHLPAGNNSLQLSVTAKGTVKFQFIVKTADEKTTISEVTKTVSANNDAQLVEVMATKSLPASAYYRVRINVTEGHGNITKITHWQLNHASSEQAYLPDYLSSPSVHTNEWKTTNADAPAGNSYDWAYEEVMVPASSDIVGTYCMSLGVLHGYMGIQVNGNNTHDIIFSMWDNGSTDNDPNLPDYLRSGSLDSNGGVNISRFGGEGTGTKAFRSGQYWEAGKWVKFLTNMRPEVITVQTADGPITYTNTICTAWYKTEGGADNVTNAEEGEDQYDGWHYIASHRLSGANTYFNGWYSFLENYNWPSGNLQRKAYYRNGSLHSLASGKWSHRNVVSCSHTDGGNAAGKRNDYGTGIETVDGEPAFYMTTGGLADDAFAENQQMPYKDNFVPITQEVMDKLLGRVEKAIQNDEARQAAAKAEATREVLSNTGITLIAQNSQQNDQPASNAFDGDPSTCWHTKWNGSGTGNGANGWPYTVDIQLPEDIRGKAIELIELYQSRGNDYRASSAEIFCSDDNSHWTTLGTYDIANADRPTITLSAPITGKQYLRLSFKTGYGNYLYLNEVYFKTARDIEQLKAQAQALIDKENSYMGYATTEMAGLKSVYNNGTCTNYDALKQAIVDLAQTGHLLKFGKLTEANSISSLKAYTLHNVSTGAALVVKNEAPDTNTDEYLTVTEKANNWLLLRSEKWNANYLYNLQAQKYLAMDSEGRAVLTDKLTPVFVGVRTHTERVNDKNVTIFDGFTFKFDQDNDNSYLCVAQSASTRGAMRVAGTAALTFGAGTADAALWNVYDNYGITPELVNVNELLENVEENGLQPWTRPQFGGTVWTWNKTTNKFEATGKESTATPNRENNHGPVYSFPAGVGTVTTAVNRDTDTSDQGGFRILGSGDNVTTSLGRWAGSIEVATGAVATVEYSNQLKGAEPTSAATVWVDGTLTFGGNRTQFAMNDGNDQRWFIGEHGLVNTTFTTINKGNHTWNLQIIVADEAPVAGKTLVQKEVTRQVMTWGADMYSNINSCTIYHKDSDGYYHETTASDVTITHNATGLSVTYTAWVNEDVAPEPEDEGIKMSTGDTKYYYSIRNVNNPQNYAHYDGNNKNLALNSNKVPSAVFYFTEAQGAPTVDGAIAVNIHNLTSANLVMNDWTNWGSTPSMNWYISDATGTANVANDYNIRRSNSGNNYWNHQGVGVASWGAGTDPGSAWYIEAVPTTELTVAVHGLTGQGGISYNGMTYADGQKFTAFFENPTIEAASVDGYSATVTVYKGVANVDYTETDPFFSTSTTNAAYHKIAFNSNKNIVISTNTNTDGQYLTSTKSSSYASNWAFIGTIDNFVLYDGTHYVGMKNDFLAPVSDLADATTFKIINNGDGTYGIVRPSSADQGFNSNTGVADGKKIGFYGVGDNGSKLVFYATDGTTLNNPTFPRSEYDIEGAASFTAPSKNTLWYTEAPGTNYNNWMEYSLPIGNGDFGGSVYGAVMNDKITVNEKSLWDGKSETNYSYAGYVKMGNVWVKNLSNAFENGVKNYVRYLDIDNAVAGVKFSDDQGTQYERTYIASEPNKVMAVRYTATGTNKLNLQFTYEPGGQLTSSSVSGQKPTTEYAVSGRVGTAKFNGKLPIVSYASQMTVKATDGTVTEDYKGITVSDATEVIVYLAGGTDFTAAHPATSFVDGTASQLPGIMASRISTASAMSWESLRSAHESNFQSYMGRVAIDLKKNGASVSSNKNTKALVDYYNTSADNKNTADGIYLEQLYYNYGRYLLISSNRNTSVPNNLQGLWNDTDNGNSPWHSDIHTNINIQMNYWPAEPNNLSDLHKPLLDHIKMLADAPGPKNQAKTKGSNVGWVINTESNLFGGMSDFKSNYTIANAWYVTHLWQHYRYTLDTEFLKSAFPAMLGAAKYWSQRLVQGTDGSYECPSEWSPEQGPDENATAHSQQLVRELFDNTIEAANTINAVSLNLMTQADLNDLTTKREGLDLGLRTEIYQHTFQNDKGETVNWNTLIADGTPILKEWKTSSYQVGENQHRHTSHLMALYPFSQLTQDVTADGTTYTAQQLFDAAKASLTQRSDNSTGWAMGWRVNLWARALDGNHARTLINNALKHARSYATDQSAGGIYYNLWDSHAPFQIDGNFGVCAGVSEMLLQSHTGVIQLLPALPDAWAEGSITGLKAVGNFTVNQEWAEGALTKATIVNKHTAAQDLYVKYKAVGADSDFDLATVKVTVDGVAKTPEFVEGKGYKLTNVASEAKVEIIFNEEPEPETVYTYTIRNKAKNKYASFNAEAKDANNNIVMARGDQGSEFTFTPVEGHDGYFSISTVNDATTYYVYCISQGGGDSNIGFTSDAAKAGAWRFAYTHSVGDIDYYNIIPEGGNQSWNARGTANSIDAVGQYDTGMDNGSNWQIASTSTEEITLTYTFTTESLNDATKSFTLHKGDFRPRSLTVPYGVTVTSTLKTDGIMTANAIETVAYTIADDYPFDYSNDFNSAHWYNLKIGNNLNVGYTTTQSDYNYPTSGSTEPANFAFLGTPWGTKIICKEAGADYGVGGTMENNASLTSVAIADAVTYIFESNSGHNVFHLDGVENGYINAVSWQSRLGNWINGAAKTDGNSTFQFIATEIEPSEVVATYTSNGKETNYYEGDDINLVDAGTTELVIPADIDNVDVTYTRDFTGTSGYQAWYVPF
ncbi:MAG: glycoside hydrolase N-terminal domain-containing protein, partial [Bacteroidales bacterium]|nr:glycoside hydrolase N-terminal domain-containing protein [Candidatus Equimonas faecalis]